MTQPGNTGPGGKPVGRTSLRSLRAAALLLVLCAPAHSQRLPSAIPGVTGTGPTLPEKREEASKAASLFNFLGYAQWPLAAFADDRTPYRLGVLGDDALLQGLQDMGRHRQVDGRAVETVRVTAASTAAELDAVHLLFVAKGQGRELSRLARTLVGRPVLLVSESSEGLKQGSVINLREVSDRISFEVSLPAAHRRGLVLSSRMLSIAHFVQTGSP